MLNKTSQPGFMKRKWVKIALVVLALLIVGGGLFAWKTGNLLNKISNGDGGLLSSLMHSLPGVKDELQGEEEGQVNIALLGMRGEGVTGGGTLADTIIIVSIRPAENKISMVSVPRDLYVTVPGTQDKQKINAVHAYGEQRGRGQGLEDMKTILSDVTGLNVAYATSINFEGFKALVDSIGGVNFHLDAPFSEAMQFNEAHVCDSFFTIPTGEFENKTIKYFSKSANIYKTRVIETHPLCNAPAGTLECGGNFSLPAGDITLNGDQALCLSRSRVTTSDFERAKRQQLIIQAIKDKLLTAGTLTDFSKLNAILDNLGDNVRTDMQAWEMKRFYELYSKMVNPQLYQRVMENSEEGMLYNPPADGAGYILLPIGDNYDKIHDVVKNIFTLPPQSDIKPKM
jgi:LCP family protein required for cell wall assembly